MCSNSVNNFKFFNFTKERTLEFEYNFIVCSYQVQNLRGSRKCQVFAFFICSVFATSLRSTDCLNPCLHHSQPQGLYEILNEIFTAMKTPVFQGPASYSELEHLKHGHHGGCQHHFSSSIWGLSHFSLHLKRVSLYGPQRFCPSLQRPLYWQCRYFSRLLQRFH